MKYDGGSSITFRVPGSTTAMNIAVVALVNALIACFLVQVCPLPLMVSPSVQSTMSSHAGVEHDISPDSGHRELSTDSLSTSANTQSDVSWHSALAASTTYHHELVSRLRSTMLSSPTFPIVTSHHAASGAQSSMHDSSNIVQLGSPPQRPPMNQMADICGRVLKNVSVENSGLAWLADNSNISLGNVDKSLSCDNSQLFVNEDSIAAGELDKSIFDDQQ